MMSLAFVTVATCFVIATQQPNRGTGDRFAEFLGQSVADLSTEEAAVFCCLAILDDKQDELDAHVRRLDIGEKEALFKQLIFLGASCDSTKVVEKSLNEYKEDFRFIEWAVDCTSAAGNYGFSVQILNRVVNQPKIYRQIAERLLIAATITGEMSQLEASSLQVDESFIKSIVENENIVRRASNIRRYKESSKKVGLSRGWAERLIGYNLDAQDPPESVEALNDALNSVTAEQSQFLTRFLFIASRIHVHDQKTAEDHYFQLKKYVQSKERLLKSRLGEMSFLASKLDDHDFLRTHLKIYVENPPDRKKAYLVLAAAEECGMEEEVFEFLSRVRRLTYSEVCAVADFGRFNESKFWERLDSLTRLRIEARLRWNECLSVGVK